MSEITSFFEILKENISTSASSPIILSHFNNENVSLTFSTVICLAIYKNSLFVMWNSIFCVVYGYVKCSCSWKVLKIKRYLKIKHIYIQFYIYHLINVMFLGISFRCQSSSWKNIIKVRDNIHVRETTSKKKNTQYTVTDLI